MHQKPLFPPANDSRRLFILLPSGENRLELDLSGLQDGAYHCQLTHNGKTAATRKFVIAR
jgi:hypothetical protein